jgi:moderate conductance mechanosensitive channel
MFTQLQALVAENLKPILIAAFRVLLILGGAYGANRLFDRALQRGWLYFIQGTRRQPGGGAADAEFEKQAATIAGVLLRTTKVLIYLLAIAMALREMGFDVAPLLAGAGVASIAIGFGAQNLVRDVISGVFLLSENQIRVNDVVVINDTSGLVEEINLRTTVLRDGEGTVHVFPNGAITKLANRTQGFSFYMFNLNLSYRDNSDRAIEILREVGQQLASEEPYAAMVLAPIEIFGVDQLGETHVVLKGRIKTLPGKQWDVGREINRRLKLRLESEGFDLPARGLRRVEVALPAGSGTLDQEALRTAVREIVAEMRADDELGKRRSAH